MEAINKKDESVNNFILNWSNFIIDYWWRRKYNIPFGSVQHREMNFIDMYIEYKEEEFFDNIRYKAEKTEDEYLGLQEDGNSVSLSQEQIDEEYEKLDLEKYNN